jgi:predicted porin
MRNTKIALAVLALVASTAAMADTTIYGALDLSVNKVTNGRTAVDGTGNWNGSIFGFKGSEDLDGGMKAFFNLEMGLNMSNGTQNNGGTTVSQLAGINATSTSVFNRLANVGVSGDFGTVTLGQQLNQFVAGSLGSNLNANESFYVPMLLVAGGGGLTFGGDGTNSGGFFQPNLITYGTPSIGGLSAAVQTQVRGNNNINGASVAADSMVAGSATYAAGPVSVTGAYLSREATSKAMSLGTTYNMGEITLNARYFKFDTDPATTTINTYNVGASYALNANNSISLQYVKNNQTSAQSVVNLGFQHNLSKNTYLYATASQAKNGALALYSQLHDASVASSTSTNGYAVGIVKGF